MDFVIVLKGQFYVTAYILITNVTLHFNTNLHTNCTNKKFPKAECVPIMGWRFYIS